MNTQPEYTTKEEPRQVPKMSKTQGTRNIQEIVLNTIAVGSSYLIIGYLVSLTLGLATRLILSRWLGVEGYGRLSIIIALSTMIYLFTMFALDISLLRYIPVERKRIENVTRVVYSTLIIIIISSTCFAALILLIRETVAVVLLGSPDFSLAIGIGALIIPLFALYTFIYSVFQGFQDMKSVMVVNIVQAITLFGLTSLLLLLGGGLLEALFAFLFANVIVVIVGIPLIRQKHLVPLETRRPHLPRSVIQLGLLIYVIQIFDVLSAQSGFLFLGYYNLAASAGILSICWMFSEIVFNLTHQVAYRGFFPLVSKMNTTQDSAVEEIFNRFMRYTLFGALIVYSILLLLPELVLPLFGSQFVLGSLAWRIIAIGFFFRTLSQPPETFLIIEERRRFEIGLHACATILCILIALFLIPVFDFTGIAIAAFCWQFIIFVGVWIFFAKTHQFKFTFLSLRLDETDRSIIKQLFRKLFRKSN